ncbi:unnamed protein product (macronuclear) [Paramecium tetraurelia]|uniref:Uncharacterized protein n=1 Tax=Paramecium tetraurelia TaxID=5888 RepID=A0E051_PARTE|nr:uncharacterized protein GSPATT00021836001 [Paramecium tetraurelia]CAK88668.1 unnamed protein product [Paramecium tetraurelia]|eukprot:XP_001456065.1 hypothetical protein (macronuclear) [Paramecium tetraurelia strain d4-2]
MDPFTEIQTTTQKSALRTTLNILMLFIKLPVFAIMVLEIVIMNDLIFLQIQRRQFHIVLHKFLRILILVHNYISGRFLLLVLGYFKYKSLFHNSTQHFRYMNLQSYCIYCTRTSPVDVFVYITYFSPSFTHLSIQKDEVKCKIISYGRAILESFQINKCGFKDFTDGENIKDLMIQIRSQRTGPLMLFWEGGVTNGQSFLKIDDIIIKEIYSITRFAKDPLQKPLYMHTNPQGMICLQNDDRMILIGNTPIQMLITILTNSFCSLEMFFLKFQPYNFIDHLPDIYQGFVEGKIKRELSDYSWKHFNEHIIQQNE